VQEGQHIRPGQQLYEGVVNAHDILRIVGREATQQHMLSDIQQVYRSQGVNINDKHFEIIFRKMLSKVEIVAPGDTRLLPGALVHRLDLEGINREAMELGGQPARGQPVLLGITKAALNVESFLSAASFQYTIRVLSRAAVESSEDRLLGLKENVILGKLIPAGTGYRGDSRSSDGPIEDYEGIALEAAVVVEETEMEEAVEGEQAEAQAAPVEEVSEILGIATAASPSPQVESAPR
jgi:DNA-directed RNA polymerase subunit beta'